MIKDELIRRSKRVLFWVLVLGVGLYVFVEFYLSQKMNQFGEVLERTKTRPRGDGIVSETLRSGSPHYDPQVYRAYLEEKNYQKTYRLLRETCSAGNANNSDFKLMIHLLESEHDVGLTPGERERKLAEYREELQARSKE